MNLASKLCLFGLALSPIGALADNVGVTMDCSQTINGKTYEAIATPIGEGNFSARLLVGGVAQTALDGCHVQNRVDLSQASQFVRCSFKVDGDRIEVYPIAHTTSGLAKFMQFVSWSGNTPTYGSFSNCIE